MLNLFILMLMLVLLAIIIMLSSINITLKIRWLPQKLFISVTASILKIKVYKREWDMLEYLKETSTVENFNKIVHVFENRFQQWKDYQQIISLILDDIVIHRLDWKTHFGTGEASSTGIILGAIQAIKEMLKGIVITNSRLSRQPKMIGIPYFQRKCFKSELDCMFSVQLTKAILIAFKILWKTEDKKEVQPVH